VGNPKGPTVPQTPPLFALLIGINTYNPEAGLASLHGAINDVRAMERTLATRFGLPAAQIVTLVNEEATHAAILAAVERHFVKRAAAWAKSHKENAPAPHFLLYFAGYGAQTLVAAGASTRFVESLVAYDSRLPGGSDLCPRELASSLAALRSAGCRATLMLDCSHSAHGGSVRELVRVAMPDLRALYATPEPSAQEAVYTGPKTWGVCNANVLSAARWGEAAYERPLPNCNGVGGGASGGTLVRGIFTLALQQVLNALPPGVALSWTALAARVIDRTTALTGAQTPYATAGDGPLFGGATFLPSPPQSVSSDDAGRLWLDAGLVQGLLAGSTLLLAHTGGDDAAQDNAAQDGEEETEQKEEAALAIVEVTQVGVERSLCMLREGSAAHLPAAAFVVQPGSARVRVRYAEAVSEQLHLQSAGTLAARVQAVAQSAAEATDFAVTQADDALWIESAEGARLAGPFAPQAVDALLAELAHRARYAACVAQRGGTADLPPGSISLVVEQLVFDEGGFPHSAPLQRHAGEATLRGSMPVVLHVTNHSDRPLEIAIFRFGAACEIAALWPHAGERREPLLPGTTRTFGCSARPEEQVHTPLPDAVTEARMIFRVYGSAAPMAEVLLEQGPLGAQHEGAQAATSSAPHPPPPPWVTDECGLRILAPAGALPLLGAQGAHVAQTRALPRVETPAGFVGALQWLGPTEIAQQGDRFWPAALAAHPQIFRPGGTGAAGGALAAHGLAGLVITCSEESRALICADAPLRLHMASPSSCALLAFAWDGESAFPVGRCPAGGGWLDIGWLPPETLRTDSGADADATARAANVSRTIRIYFCEVQGVPAVDVGLFAVRFVPAGWAAAASRAHFARTVPGGEMRYTRPARAKPGERIALLIHGFADDSAEETHWLAQLQATTTIPAYDRVLAFEWETLHSDVRAASQRLRDDVAALALEEAPDATIDLFAHSMGALVARTYVELLGGDVHVRRCFFTGPPNLGTPLADTALFVPWLLTLLINLPAPTPPTLLIAWAMGTLAANVQGPMAMHTNAPLLQELNNTRGKTRLHYHIVAGNGQHAESRRAAEWRRVVADGLHAAADWFYDGDNDWVVGVRSSLAVPVANHPGGLLLSAVVDATHVTYFRSPAMTAQMVRWLASVR
jgi:hypothetical protein